MSYLTYNIQTWNTIGLHCDKLEYAEGGVRPVECREELTNLNSLMARTGRACREDNEDDVQFPVKPAGRFYESMASMKISIWNCVICNL